ncbi:MAG: ABC transporter ATP-binding protein [Ferrovum sp.]|jgi:phospholipid/cholesterol/gamma-HCH transport system ATP-binding protein|nr:ABC transporter ATP-binding protein [Ferrovum sp.]NDU87552.1 ABC transporter ATP-binding protein [Ferrovum sp.]
MTNLVEISDLNFGYGESLVLKGINLTVPRGSLVAIMGLSGCGKTTLLRLMGGQLQAQQGSVRVAGQELNHMDERQLYAMRRRIGMLFQFGALFTDLTVFDNVAFQMREHTDLPESMIRDLTLMKLNAVGLRGVQSLMPSELSGGMARRVALARATALDPQLMLYDEPFTGLDPISLGAIGRLVRQFNDALGITSVLVTHDVQESMKIVDYIYFVADGVIVAQGSPAEIRASTLPFVHQFVWGEADGPMPFHYPSQTMGADFGLAGEVR